MGGDAPCREVRESPGGVAIADTGADKGRGSGWHPGTSAGVWSPPAGRSWGAGEAEHCSVFKGTVGFELQGELWVWTGWQGETGGREAREEAD